MITVEQLTKRRGARAVVSDVTFRCEPGTVAGLLGPNGAGDRPRPRLTRLDKNHAVRAAPASPAGAARRCRAAARWCKDNQDAARQWLAECCIDREAARFREPREGNYHRARGRALEPLGGGFSERKRTGPVVVQSATGIRARTTVPAVGRLSISSVR
jgi:hypothetical protein